MKASSNGRLAGIDIIVGPMENKIIKLTRPMGIDRHIIALVSPPCIAPGLVPCGIAVLKKRLSQIGTKVKCFYLANEFEQYLVDNSPDLGEMYDQASEVGFDYQNAYFSGLVFGHEDPALLVKKAVWRLFTGRTQLPKDLNDAVISERSLQAAEKKEVSSALRFCELLKLFCEQKTEHVLSYSPSLVGFSCLSSQLFVALYIAKIIKQERLSTGVVLGGGFISKWNGGFYAASLPYIDCFVVGRDVIKIAESLTVFGRVNRRSKLLVVPDNQQNSHYVSPDYSDATQILQRDDRPEVSVPLGNSYGCSWGHCTFCPAEKNRKDQQTWCPDAVSKFVVEMASRNGLSDFTFSEWEINTDCTRLQRFCENVHKEGLRLHFWGEFTPSLCTRELFSSMAKCGRWCLQMGIESFSDDLLKLMRKRQSVVDNINAIRLALEEDVGFVSFNLIHGFPGTRAMHVRQTRTLIRKISHLLSDSRVYIDTIPFYRHRLQGTLGKGALAETHYLPRQLRKDFPTQLLPHNGRNGFLSLWSEVEDELESLEPCYFCAFEAGKFVVVEDYRENHHSITVDGLNRDLLRCLLDGVYTCACLAKVVGTTRKEVKEGLRVLVEMGLAVKSDHRYTALPTRG